MTCISYEGTDGQLRRCKVVEREVFVYDLVAVTAMGKGVWRAGNRVCSALKAKMNCAFKKEEAQESNKGCSPPTNVILRMSVILFHREQISRDSRTLKYYTIIVG